MKNNPKTVTLNSATYAQSGELGETHGTLERLWEEGKVGKVAFNGSVYFEVEAVKRELASKRAIPAGYVRAADHAALFGVERWQARELCAQPNAPARKVMTGGTKSSWYVDQKWFETQLRTKLMTETPKPRVTTTKTSTVETAAIKALQNEIKELRSVIANMTRGRHTAQVATYTDEAAREMGFMPLLQACQAFGLAHATARGWIARGTVRAFKISGKLYVNVEDLTRMAQKLPENRAMVTARMGDRTNNNLSTANGTSYSGS